MTNEFYGLIDEISNLKSENRRLENKLTEVENDFRIQISKLENRIIELEERNKNV